GRRGARDQRGTRGGKGQSDAHLGGQQADRARGWWVGTSSAKPDVVSSRSGESPSAFHHGDRRNRRGLRGQRADGTRGGVQGARDPSCPRLPSSLVPVADTQPSRRR